MDKEDEKIIAGKGRILVMDDDAGIRNTINRMMRRLGYSVSFAEEGGKAIELYKETRKSGRPYHIVILDLTVPGGMGGIETIKDLIEINPDVKVIVSSGYADDPVMAEYERYGFKGVISKPYAIVELSRVLSQVLKKR